MSTKTSTHISLANSKYKTTKDTGLRAPGIMLVNKIDFKSWLVYR